VQLNVDAKAYKLDDIQRKIPRITDGIPVARRKVLAGALKRFSNNNKEVKVFQLGGYIAEHMFYHHGDASLNGTIVGMAQRFPCALNYPYLTGIGQFGSRHGKDSDSPAAGIQSAERHIHGLRPADEFQRQVDAATLLLTDCFVDPGLGGWIDSEVGPEFQRSLPGLRLGIDRHDESGTHHSRQNYCVGAQAAAAHHGDGLARRQVAARSQSMKRG